MTDQSRLYASFETARIDLSSVSYRQGQRRARCPECAHKRKPEHRNEKDLSINFDDQTWFCHHCGWAGRVADSPHYLQPKGPKYTPPRTISPTGITEKDRQTFTQFFEDRGIDATTLETFHVTPQILKAPQDGKPHLVASFPYYTADGNHVNTKHRTIDGTRLYWGEAKAEQIFYNLNNIDPELPLTIVEGEIDAISCHLAGYPNVVSVPGGAPDTEGQSFVSKFQFFESAIDLLESIPAFVLATDADTPGRILEGELARRLGEIKCRKLDWTTEPEAKDANDLLVYYGPLGLAARLYNAVVFPVVGLYTGDDLISDLDLAYEQGWDRGALCGLPALDDIARFARGYISIWTGHSGSGKSTALDNVLVGLASTSDWATALYSPEQMPLARHQVNMLQIKSGKPFNATDKWGNINHDRMTPTEYRQTNWWLSQYLSYVMPKDKRDLHSILEHILKEVRRRGIVAFVIDPWNCIADEKPNHMAGGDWINKALFDIKLFAQETNTHGFIVAHPTKLKATRPGQPEPRPTLTDISGSINFRNQADYGIVVHRDQGSQRNKNLVSISAAKIRMEETGDMGKNAWFEYDHRTARILPYNGIPPQDED